MEPNANATDVGMPCASLRTGAASGLKLACPRTGLSLEPNANDPADRAGPYILRTGLSLEPNAYDPADRAGPYILRTGLSLEPNAYPMGAATLIDTLRTGLSLEPNAYTWQRAYLAATLRTGLSLEPNAYETTTTTEVLLLRTGLSLEPNAYRARRFCRQTPLLSPVGCYGKGMPGRSIERTPTIPLLQQRPPDRCRTTPGVDR